MIVTISQEFDCKLFVNEELCLSYLKTMGVEVPELIYTGKDPAKVKAMNGFHVLHCSITHPSRDIPQTTKRVNRAPRKHVIETISPDAVVTTHTSISAAHLHITQTHPDITFWVVQGSLNTALHKKPISAQQLEGWQIKRLNSTIAKRRCYPHVLGERRLVRGVWTTDLIRPPPVEATPEPTEPPAVTTE